MARPVSLESIVGKTRRKARGLEKIGHRGPAGQLRLQAAQQDIAGTGGLPTQQERAAGNLADSMLMAARHRAASPDFSYEQDILPYKQAVEGLSFGVSDDPQERARFRDPIMENLSATGLDALKEREAMAGLRYRDLAFETQQQSLLDAKTKFQKQQEAEARVGEMGDELGRIINSPGSSTAKAKSMFTHVMKNPSFYQTQLGGSMYKSAMASLPGFETLTPMQKTALDYATKVNSPEAVRQIVNSADVPKELADSMTKAAEHEAARQQAVLRNYNKQGGAAMTNIIKVAMDSIQNAESKDANHATVVGAANDVLQAATYLGFADASIEALKAALQVAPKADTKLKVEGNEESKALLNAIQVAASQLRFYVATLNSVATRGATGGRPDPSTRPGSGMKVPPRE